MAIAGNCGFGGFPHGSVVKHPPAMQEMLVRSLDQEDLLEKEMATHSSPELTQTHVHRIGDAIQPSHPLSFPSPPALNLSYHHFFNFSLNLAIRNSWSEPQSAPGLVFADCIELLHLWLQRI